MLPTLESALRPLQRANTLTLADAVARYLETRKPPVKAVMETKLALRQFEQVIGRKSLSATTRDDAHRFVEYLADHKVGGKTRAGSSVTYRSRAFASGSACLGPPSTIAVTGGCSMAIMSWRA